VTLDTLRRLRQLATVDQQIRDEYRAEPDAVRAAAREHSREGIENRMIAVALTDCGRAMLRRSEYRSHTTGEDA
jgi:hypothetical protein